MGAAAGGGYFGLRGVYVLTGDGYLHEQIMATGLDYAPPVKFFPAPGGSSFGLNMDDKIVYTAAGSGCKNVADAIWSIDLNTPDYTVSSYKAQKLSVAGLTGPAIGRDGTAYIMTGTGPDDPAAGLYANSVVALNAKDLKVKDWYTPSDAAKSKTLNATPVVFTLKDKELIAAPGKDGTLVLLDSASLGGADHHTPLSQTDKVAESAKRGAWESLASWQDKAGATLGVRVDRRPGGARCEICHHQRHSNAWQHRGLQGGRERRAPGADSQLDLSRSQKSGAAGHRQRSGLCPRRRR